MKAYVFVLVLLLSTFVRGQQLGSTTASAVVSPPVFPEFLPIQSQAAMLDWAVTNRQWEEYPLVSGTGWSIGKEGLVFPFITADSSYRTFENWDHFVDSYKKFGIDILNQLRLSGRVDGNTEVYFLVDRDFFDIEKGIGDTGVYLKIELGKLSGVTEESFLKTPSEFWTKSVVRINGLQSFEVSTEDGPWISKSINLGDFISIRPEDVSFGLKKVRYRITVGGVTRYYTQHGYPVTSPEVKFDGFRVFVKKTPGSITVVETSDDLNNWTKYTEIGWVDEDTEKVVTVYPLKPKQFFRAYSK